MIKMQFRCTLLSDVILNVKSASEGPNKTLDFIPGSCFLGIAASSGGYDAFKDNAMEVFHSGRVRFGDAHPSQGDRRSLKVPASMFYPKMKKASEKCYIHHCYDRYADKEDNGGPQQLKQCRNGFYMFSDQTGTPVGCEKSFAIKSAYDSSKRRSEDAAMYGYESLDKGQEFLFEVEVDRDELAKDIEASLCGERHIGRSRTSQYGLASISAATYQETQSTDDYCDYLTVYADGRLIFFDEFGLPTFKPAIQDLGLETGEIDWSKSQIRTFQYAPWNYKRQAFDADRCGIEKGSVIVVRGCSDRNLASRYVGSYRNEGFGKVIYNPDFLKADKNDNGVACYRLKDFQCHNQTSPRETVIPEDKCTTPLLKYINGRLKQEYVEERIYGEVNDFVRKMGKAFQGPQFASQWGTIRSIACSSRTRTDILYELFDKTIEKKTYEGEENRTIRNTEGLQARKVQTKLEPFAYLTHGVASDKWSKRGRKDALRSFLDKFTGDDDTRNALINLASQMAKYCKK